MIIVSQDKKEITNFENISKIYITNRSWEDFEDLAPNTDELLKPLKKYVIRAKTKYQDYYDIGEYLTEEKALEVFQQLLERISNWENLKIGQPIGICNPIYQMPKE